jgi:hypothetical protein
MLAPRHSKTGGKMRDVLINLGRYSFGFVIMSAGTCPDPGRALSDGAHGDKRCAARM